MNRNILIIIIVSVILCSVFVSGYIPSTIIDNTPKYSPSYCNNGCDYGGKCYAITTMMHTYLGSNLMYCDKEDNKYNNYNFADYPKITGQSCANDTDCQSKECDYGECAQKKEIKITEVYNNKILNIQNLYFPESETFFFKIFDTIHSIRFIQNDSNFIFLINGTSYNVDNKKMFVLNNNSQFILNNIFFEHGVAKANITFIDSKIPFTNSEKIMNDLFGDKKTTKENYSTPITGNVIETKQGNFISNIWENIKGFFKNIFNKK